MFDYSILSHNGEGYEKGVRIIATVIAIDALGINLLNLQ